MALFESYERREKQILAKLAEYGINSIEEAAEVTKAAGLDVYKMIEGIQPICFENAKWAYTVGAAIAIKKGCRKASEAAAAIGEGLQSFCIPGSVADQRKVGLGHGNLGKMLLEEDTECFAFLAGHESFAAAEGAIGIAEKANKVRKKPLRVILNGLGKDAAQIISRINGFTYVETEYDPYKNEVKEVFRKAYSEGLRAKVNCYGANSVPEGVAIMWKEGVDVSITGNSTNPTRFQHPVAGTYKKECNEKGKKYFSVASGGGTGRTLHPDNMAAGPASYGMTDTLGRMHSDAQFAGSSSVPAHVEMMGLIGAGNNPMVGMTVAVAVAAAPVIQRERALIAHCSALALQRLAVDLHRIAVQRRVVGVVGQGQGVEQRVDVGRILGLRIARRGAEDRIAVVGPQRRPAGHRRAVTLQGYAVEDPVSVVRGHHDRRHVAVVLRAGERPGVLDLED